MNRKITSSIIIGSIVGSFFLASLAYAATPTLSAFYTNTGDNVSVNITNADPGYNVLLYSNGNLQSIGTTNSSGAFSNTISTSQYDITPGSIVYVSVDGQQSNSLEWPYTSGSGSSQTITFSQNNLNIPTGETATVTVGGGTGVYVITNNSNSASVGASINGDVVSLYASNVAGTATITVCSSNQSSCGVIDLTVGTNSNNNSTLLFSNTAPSLSVNQSVNISIVGGVSPYYIGSNSNSGVVTAVISNNIVTLSGIETGSANITVCSNTSVCQTLPVTVDSTTSGSLTVGQTNITLTPGQGDAVTISGGSGTYYVSSNTNGSVASSVVNGSSVTISGVAVGNDNVSVCSSDGLCSTIYVTVTGSTTTTTSVNTGSSLTLTQILSVGQAVNILLSGGTAPYSISSNQSSDFSTSINSGDVLTLTGVSAGESSVTVCSLNNICIPIYVDVTSAVSGISGTTTASSQYDFTTILNFGMTSDAVTALQEQLTKDGVYNGPITGYYGDLTTAAVQAFQSKHGISPVGYVGPATRAALNAGE